MSRPLLKYFVKKNWYLLAGFTGLLLLEFVICIFMMNLIKGMTDKLLGGAPGLSEDAPVDGAYALSFISNLFPMYGVMFPMVFYIMTIFKVLSKPVDNTSLSAHLMTGMPRWKYIATAAVFVLGSIFAIFLSVFVVAGLCMLRWGQIDWVAWLNLNASFMFQSFAIASVCFFFAGTFAATKQGTGLAIGVPIVFVLLNMLGGYIKFFGYFTLIGWIDIEKVVAGTFGLWWLVDLVFLIVTGCFFVATLFMFKRKQLSI
ncbi:MAG: hypothetical protein LBG88_02895 [Christensenellaceae bacterium]|jgi:ABC-2 type transport system permease protein|nr:hypothetical protein [Christensenellaceae bacterium]